MIRHLKRALKAGDITVLHDTNEYDSRLEGVLKKSVKKTEGDLTIFLNMSMTYSFHNIIFEIKQNLLHWVS